MMLYAPHIFASVDEKPLSIDILGKGEKGEWPRVG